MRICLQLSRPAIAGIVWLLVAMLAAGQGKALAAQAAATITRLPTQLSDGDAIAQEFYRMRGNQRAWNSSDIAILEAFLARAADEGLNPEDYLPITDASAEGRDIALTRAALKYLRDVRQGREPLRFIDDDIALPRSPFDTAKALNDALNSNSLASLLADSTPTISDYARLKGALEFYRMVESRGGWPTLTLPFGGLARLTFQQARALRDRLT